MKIIKDWFYIVLILIALGVLVYYQKENSDCNKAGGQYVRTLWGMECIDA